MGKGQRFGGGGKNGAVSCLCVTWKGVVVFLWCSEGPPPLNCFSIISRRINRLEDLLRERWQRESHGTEIEGRNGGFIRGGGE